VKTAASAVEALTMLESFQPDVLVSDLAMVERDGYDLIQQIRALPAAAGGQISAIALTAYAQVEDQQRAIASGYQTHLAKPIDIKQLVRAIANLAGNCRETQGLTSHSNNSESTLH
jgi:CheY-like chemotaxis protein